MYIFFLQLIFCKDIYNKSGEVSNVLSKKNQEKGWIPFIRGQETRRIYNK